MLLNVFVGFVVLAFSLYLAWFFRDPQRIIFTDEKLFFAAADGKIVHIRQERQNLEVAIRMSPFNVHINRSPVSGKVTQIEHTLGGHKSVYFANFENKNERKLTVIENKVAIVEVLQLTGAFARRIETWINPDESVIQGQKIGMIRFGSQTNISIRLIKKGKSINPLVALGNKVYAGLTSIAEIVEEDE